MSVRLGKLGVWCWFDNYDHRQAVDFVQCLEKWGYSSLWMPEAVGREPFSTIGFLGANTSELIFATGIANIYARDAMTMTATRQTLSEALPNRFVMGLGVSHAHLVSKLRGHEYQKPVPAMRAYLEGMEKALYMGATADEPAPIILAALRKYMLRLARDKARGAHPYLVPVEHTAMAREELGEGPWLCPEQMVLHETDAQVARAIARKHLAVYIRLPNYQNNLRDFGFTDEDFADGGSDKLVDAIVAWGDADTIRERIEAHYRHGADHVCIQPFRSDGEMGPDAELLRALAPNG